MRRLWLPVNSMTAAIVLTVALSGFVLPFAGQRTDAATPTPQAHAQPTATQTPRPTRTPTLTSTPVPVLTPLPSFDDLRYYTPIAEAPTAPPETAEAPLSTPIPLRVPGQGQPPRTPVRATQLESVVTAAAEPLAAPVVQGPVAEPTLKPAAPLPAATTRSTRLPPAPVSNAQPPIDLTPAGVAGGGPASTPAPIASNTLIVVGIGLLAAGGSWGFYYLLREND
jgi:hypothetical protein